IEKAKKAAEKIGVDYKEGVYALFSGPCYETSAEIRAYEVLGADVVGMSTVPETIAANYLGMKVFGVSCITNMATGIAERKHSHEEVVRVANESSEKLCKWLKTMLIDW
ncbi:MAG: purine-nucleoside phosphorylase, partial [Oscillospiraceae bacterium]|nr:purine-nucleoside phosphorylase [Oscillospiraceae bacterium]